MIVGRCERSQGRAAAFQVLSVQWWGGERGAVGRSPQAEGARTPPWEEEEPLLHNLSWGVVYWPALVRSLSGC